MARHAGIPNMNDKDKLLLVRIVKALIPKGNDHWSKVEKIYNRHSQRRSTKINEQFVQRTAKTLRNQFNKILKGKKPTGDLVRTRIYQKAMEAKDLIEFDTMPVSLKDEVLSDVPEDEPVEHEDFGEFRISDEEDETEEDLFLSDNDVPASYFPVIGEAIKEDINPAPTVRHESNTAEFGDSIARLADAMTRKMEVEQESDARFQRIEEQMKSMHCMLKMILEKLSDGEESCKRQRTK